MPWELDDEGKVLTCHGCGMEGEVPDVLQQFPEQGDPYRCKHCRQEFMDMKYSVGRFA